MHTATIHSGLIGLALTAFLGASSVAVAETITYKAVLNAQSQPTPNDSKGAGTAEVTYDTTSKTLTWTVTFDGLTGPATAAHFHGPAEPGQNADLAAGRWYINIHTAANRGGEIRGQVVK
jgi:CHRD domain